MEHLAPMSRVAVTVEQSWHRVPGGTAWSVLELLRALRDVPGLEVLGVSARHRQPPPEPWVPPVEVRQMALPRNLLYETWHLPFARFPKVERVTGPVDVVHASAVVYPACDAPVVVTVHDLAFLEDPLLATKHGHRFFRRGTALARERAAIVVCPSDATRRACEAEGFAPERLRVVPWGVDTARVSDEDVAAARAAHGLTAPYALFCGTVEPRKNLPNLLAAFRAIERRDVTLVLAGPAGWHQDLSEGLAALGDRVRQVGFLPRRELDGLIAGAAVVCYPSTSEGFGMPVLEAMAQGAPVVTSRHTAMEEVAGDAAALVDPHDVASITAALDRVLGDEEYAASLRVMGPARAAQFTWAATASAYAAIYRDAAR